jgi:hypothetical protein
MRSSSENENPSKTEKGSCEKIADLLRTHVALPFLGQCLHGQQPSIHILDQGKKHSDRNEDEGLL